jgi:hypothetical protein
VDVLADPRNVRVVVKDGRIHKATLAAAPEPSPSIA